MWKSSQSTVAPVTWIRRPASASALRGATSCSTLFLGREPGFAPGGEATGKVRHLGHAVGLQEARGDHRPSTAGALEHKGAVLRKLVHPGGEFGKGDVGRAGDVPFTPLTRGADIDDDVVA